MSVKEGLTIAVLTRFVITLKDPITALLKLINNSLRKYKGN